MYFVSTKCSKYPQYLLTHLSSKLRKVEDGKRAKQSRENHAIFSGSHERAEFRFDFANPYNPKTHYPEGSGNL